VEGRQGEASYAAAVNEPWRPDKSTLDETDKKVLADFERYGWHCMHVHDEGELPYWSFSIGVFRSWQHPELVVFGLKDTVAHDLMTQLVNRIKTDESFSPRRDYKDILEGHRCRFIRVDPLWYSGFLGYAQWFYETEEGFPVLQLVWPDQQGLYPWQAGYAITDGSQPLLVSDEEAVALGFAPPEQK